MCLPAVTVQKRRATKVHRGVASRAFRSFTSAGVWWNVSACAAERYVDKNTTGSAHHKELASMKLRSTFEAMKIRR